MSKKTTITGVYDGRYQVGDRLQIALANVTGWDGLDTGQLYKVTFKKIAPTPQDTIPCPFCGANNTTLGRSVRSGCAVVYMMCLSCGSRGPDHDTMAGATRNWNRRSANEANT